MLVLLPLACTASFVSFDGCATPGAMARASGACCPPACGKCGGDGCAKRPGGRKQCCTTSVLASMRACSGGPPCVLDLQQHRSVRAFLAQHPEERAKRLADELAKFAKVDSQILSQNDTTDATTATAYNNSAHTQPPPSSLQPEYFPLYLGAAAFVCALGLLSQLFLRQGITAGWRMIVYRLLTVLVLSTAVFSANGWATGAQRAQRLDHARLTAAHVTRRPPWPALTPRSFEPLALGAVTPRGWLEKQLLLQAD